MKFKLVNSTLVACGILAVTGCSSTDGTSATSTDRAVPTALSAAVSTTSTNRTLRISVIVGVDSGKDRIEEIPLGSQVELSLTNPLETDEYHVHGYDLGSGNTPKGETKTFTFTSDKVGDFEVESHATEEVLVVLRIS